MAEIDELRTRRCGGQGFLGPDGVDVERDFGDARAVREDARVCPQAASLAVNSGLMPAGSPMASATVGLVWGGPLAIPRALPLLSVATVSPACGAPQLVAGGLAAISIVQFTPHAAGCRYLRL
jgi:hypothetical protein